jgi:hypothetical protein
LGSWLSTFHTSTCRTWLSTVAFRRVKSHFQFKLKMVKSHFQFKFKMVKSHLELQIKNGKKSFTVTKNG